MADTRVKIVDIQVNITSAAQALAQYGQAIDEAKVKQKQLKQELKDGKITQEQYQAAMAYSRTEVKANQDAARDLTNQVQRQITMVKAQEGSIKQLKAELAQATTQYQNMSRAERESSSGTQLKAHIASLKTEIASASAETSAFYKNMGNPSQAVQGLNNLKGKAADLVKQMAMMATGGGIVALGKNLIETTRNFEDGMARVQAVTNATQAEFQMMEQEALKWGSTTRYTATEAANSLENLTRNGLSAQQATEALGPTLQLAQANTIGLAEAADITTNVMNGFGLEVKDMGRVNDVLSSTAAHSATNISMLAEAEKNAAPFGHSLGQSIEEVNAALGVLADVGIKGSDAGTAIRMVLMGLASPTAKQQKAFKQLGVDISESSLRSEGLTKTLEKLRDSGVMKAANSAELLGDIFGRRVAPQAMALLNNIDGLKTKLDILNNSQGTTERMFKQSYSELSNSLYGVQSAWENLQITLGKTTDNPLVTFTESIRKGILWITMNLSTVGKVIMDVIAGISFAKLVSSARTAFAEITTSAYSSAQNASMAVKTSQAKEQTLRRETATLTAQLENNKTAANKMSAEQQKLIETQLAAKKQQLAIQTANTQKLQATEVAKWNQVQAITSGNAWTKGMAVAGIAARSFVMTCKTAFKGFIVTAILSLAFEALMSLYDAFVHGTGYLAPFANWVKGTFTKVWTALVNVFHSVINVFKLFAARIDITGRAARAFAVTVAIVGAAFKSMMEIGKFAITTIVSYFKMLGNVAKGAGAILADVFTLNWGNIKNDFANLAKSVADFGKGVANKFANMSNIIKNNTKEAANAINSADKKYNKEHNARVSGTVSEIKSQRNSNQATTTNTKVQSKKKQAPQKPKPQKPKPQKPDKENDNTPTPPASVDDKALKKQKSAADKAAREQEQQAKKEQEVLKAAHDAMLATMEDTIEKRRIQIETQYNDEINKLKSRLATERNLTATARDAINETIKYKEIKKNQELEKLSDENIKQEVARQQKYIDARLSVVQKGSAEELALKKQKIEEETKLSLNNLKNDSKTGTLDATEKRDNAKNEMNAAKAKLDSDKANGADADTIAKDQEAYNAKVAAYQAMEEALTNITAQYEQERIDIETRARKQKAQADLEFAQQQEADRQQVFANRLAELQMEGEQQTELQQNLNTLGLDVQTQNERDQLEVQQQAAQEKLDYLQQFQQQEGESEDEYTQRLADVGMTRLDVETQNTEARKNLADVSAQINQGEIKNEEAKQKAFQSVGTSMISMLDTLGESNSAFAKMSKIITLAQIAIDTGKALSAGIASAASLPYPANLAAIATTVATVLANVATAISTVKSAKFAEGGKVIGPGTGTSDSINAQLSNGEYVMTAKATRMFEPMLAAMNAIGSGVPIASSRNFSVVQNTQDMTDSFTEAAQEIKPIVSVVEITEAQNRVETIQNIDNV
jgi:TP901 family phage tail tape measure protein|nr:MAG TPA_asm: minor tail protein [Caudoviricetes sp.]